MDQEEEKNWELEKLQNNADDWVSASSFFSLVFFPIFFCLIVCSFVNHHKHPNHSYCFQFSSAFILARFNSFFHFDLLCMCVCVWLLIHSRYLLFPAIALSSPSFRLFIKFSSLKNEKFYSMEIEDFLSIFIV